MMELSIKRKGALNSRRASRFVLSSFSLVELKYFLSLVAMSAVFTFGLPSMLNGISLDMKDKTTLVKTKLASAKLTKAPVVVKLDNKYVTGYKFAYTSLGFSNKSLKFIERRSAQDAERKILKLLPGSLQKRAKPYIKAVLVVSEKYQVDPLWALSIMWTESHFNPKSKSHVGARGLMQIMPATRKFLYRTMVRRGELLIVEKADFRINDYFSSDISEKKKNIYVKKLVNIELGVRYLKQLLKSFNFNHKLATVAYNMGPGWTKMRLRRRLPVGVKNEYLTKVNYAYKYMARRI